MKRLAIEHALRIYSSSNCQCTGIPCVIPRRFQSSTTSNTSIIKKGKAKEIKEDKQGSSSPKVPNGDFKIGNKVYRLIEPSRTHSSVDSKLKLKPTSEKQQSSSKRQLNTYISPQSHDFPKVAVPLKETYIKDALGKEAKDSSDREKNGGNESKAENLMKSGNIASNSTRVSTFEKASKGTVECEENQANSEAKLFELKTEVNPLFSNDFVPNPVLVSSAELNTKKAKKIFKVLPEDRVLNSILNSPLYSKKPSLQSVVPGKLMRVSDSREDWGIPSVSRILGDTMSPTAAANLARWEETMIGKLGQEGFLNYKSALLQQGHDFHSLIEMFLVNKSSSDVEKYSSVVKACWQSVHKVLSDVKNVWAIESHVKHPALMYRGFVDCVADFKGRPVLIEWKHAEKKKSRLSSTYDNPVQLMAYVGAMNFDSSYPFQIDGSLLVIAYTDGSPADVYELSQNDCEKYWQEWLQRVELFWNMQRNLQGHLSTTPTLTPTVEVCKEEAKTQSSSDTRQTPVETKIRKEEQVETSDVYRASIATQVQDTLEVNLNSHTNLNASQTLGQSKEPKEAFSSEKGCKNASQTSHAKSYDQDSSQKQSIPVGSAKEIKEQVQEKIKSFWKLWK